MHHPLYISARLLYCRSLWVLGGRCSGSCRELGYLDTNAHRAELNEKSDVSAGPRSSAPSCPQPPAAGRPRRIREIYLGHDLPRLAWLFGDVIRALAEKLDQPWSVIGGTPRCTLKRIPSVKTLPEHLPRIILKNSDISIGVFVGIRGHWRTLQVCLKFIGDEFIGGTILLDKVTRWYCKSSCFY